MSALRRSPLLDAGSGGPYEILFRLHPKPMFVCDPAALRFLDVNEAAVRHYGYSRRSFLAMTLKDIWLREDVPSSWGGGRRDGQAGSGLFRHVRKDGSSIDVEVAWQRVSFKGRRAALAVVQDVTEAKRVERALQDGEEVLRQLAENIDAVFWVADQTFCRPLYISPGYKRIFGRSPRPLLDDPDAWEKTIHPDDLQRVRQSRAVRAPLGVLEMEYRVVRPDGAVRWVHSRSFPVKDGDGRVYRSAGFILDITDRRRLESELLEIRAKERERLGRDLHDGLGQQLAGIGFMVQALERGLAVQARAEAAEARRIGAIVQDSIRAVRALSRGLNPVEPSADGLMRSLSGLAESMRTMFGAACTFRCPRPVLLSDHEKANDLLLIVQEAVHNGMRHGGARKFWISLRARGGRLVLRVANDGRSLPEPVPRRGMGLRSMSTRAQRLGGSLSLSPRPGGGVQVVCSCPA